jgi:hypothetical protein
MKGQSTIILHGSTSQKTILNFILAAVRTLNLLLLLLLPFLVTGFLSSLVLLLLSQASSLSL